MGNTLKRQDISNLPCGQQLSPTRNGLSGRGARRYVAAEQSAQETLPLHKFLFANTQKEGVKSSIRLHMDRPPTPTPRPDPTNSQGDSDRRTHHCIGRSIEQGQWRRTVIVRAPPVRRRRRAAAAAAHPRRSGSTCTRESSCRCRRRRRWPAPWAPALWPPRATTRRSCSCLAAGWVRRTGPFLPSRTPPRSSCRTLDTPRSPVLLLPASPDTPRAQIRPTSRTRLSSRSGPETRNHRWSTGFFPVHFIHCLLTIDPGL